ncbi:hypothetical protein D3C87_2092340 [compost metagenome]
MLGDEGFEALHQFLGAVATLTETGAHELVAGDGVDHQIGFLPELEDEFAQGGVAEGLGGLLQAR